MHERSIYTQPLNYSRLAIDYPELQDFLHHGTFDFGDHRAVRALNRVLLKRDFDLEVDLPEDRLCPTVPNRLNYVLWIEDLIGQTVSADETPVIGLDIGTGASAIYALLACRRNSSWSMYALESDSVSLNTARHNVRCNGFAERIIVLESVTHSRLLLQHACIQNLQAHFTMCNPPFYSSVEDMRTSLLGKTDSPSSACNGAHSEKITQGGELEFTRRLLQDSLELKRHIQWYTTMLGKLSSLEVIVHDLRQNHINNYAISQLVQGKTRRWVVAWSFCSARPKSFFARGCLSLSTRSLLPVNSSIVLPFVADHNGVERLFCFLNQHKISWVRLAEDKEIYVTFAVNTWSRAARRAQAKDQSSKLHDETRVVIAYSDTACTANWTHGLDSGLWESFCGKLCSAISRR